ncbi:hypothetical protein Tco_0503052 [Tanacetum coccineum]
MPPRMRTRSAGRPAAESLRGGTGVRGLGANGGVEGVNGNVEEANGGTPDFSTIISQELQNLLPAMLAQVSNRGNVGNQNGNVVNENVQENVGNVLVNGNRVGCSYKEFLACNPKEYDGKGGAVVLTRWIEKMENCLADPTLKVPLDEIRVDAKLNFVEEPVEILEREFKKLKRSRIAIVKVRWNSKRGPEFTWEREDQMKLKYPHLFSDVSS